MSRTLYCLVLICLLTAACGLPLPSSIATPKLSVSASPTQPAPTTVQSTQSAGLSSVKLYLVALEDNGASGPLIGCGDSLVAVDVPITPTWGDLLDAYMHLLSLKTPYYGQSGLYNALYQSNLTIESLDLDDGKVVIRLTGQLTLGGVCDIPRVQAQLEQTALQFNTVKSVQLFVNGIPLEDALSLK